MKIKRNRVKDFSDEKLESGIRLTDYLTFGFLIGTFLPIIGMMISAIYNDMVSFALYVAVIAFLVGSAACIRSVYVRLCCEVRIREVFTSSTTKGESKKEKLE